jgi:hypothetical protein
MMFISLALTSVFALRSTLFSQQTAKTRHLLKNKDSFIRTERHSPVVYFSGPASHSIQEQPVTKPSIDINFLPERGKKLLQLAKIEHTRLSQYLQLPTITSLVIPARNEEKYIAGALENIRLNSLHFSQQKDQTLHIILVANGCQDNTVKNAKAWAEKQNIPFRIIGDDLQRSAPQPPQVPLILDIANIPACSKVSAILYAGGLYEKWGHLPGSFAYMDADTRLTSRAAAEMLQPNTETNEIILGNIQFYVPDSHQLDTATPWRPGFKKLFQRLNVLDDVWSRINGQSTKQLDIPSWSGAAVSSTAPNILALLKAFETESSDLFGEDPVVSRLARVMGLKLKTESKAQVWTLALPASKEEQLLKQKSRWGANRLQIPELFGPLTDHEAVSTFTPESITVPNPKVKEAYQQALRKDGWSTDAVQLKTQELESWWAKVQDGAKLMLARTHSQNCNQWNSERS